MKRLWVRISALTRRPRVIIAIAVLAIAAAVWLRCGPVDPKLLDAVDATSTTVLDRHGVVLYEALSDGGTRVERMLPDALPPTVVAATIAAEDRRFWRHPGIDPFAILRAMRHNIMERHVVEGGSTITQQVAKLLIQRRDGVQPRSVRAKLREAILAIRLEHRFDKRELLAMYLNLAAYGNNIAGLARASRAYFGVTPGMLTPAQAAYLAGLPQRPASFNPWRDPTLAMSRQRAILRRMRGMDALTDEQLAAATNERLAFRSGSSPFLAPHFVEMVLADAGSPRPRTITTTLDAELQRDVEGIIDAQRPVLDAHGAANVAVVVLDNRRGEWIAWEGSGDYFDARHGGTINGPVVPRQPGSALKPFTYALAFEQGGSPATVLPDIPSAFPTAEEGVVYTPRNYDGRYRGPLLARAALAGSENVPAVALASELGVPTLIRFLARAGLTTFDRNAAYYGVGVTLGNAEVRLDELVAAYAAFARGGVWRKPAVIAGNASREDRRIMSPRTAFWITDILSDDEARAYAFGRGSALEFPFPVAAKTGTSQAYHDNWTIGYTRDVTVGVWVGNFDRAPLRDSSGVTGAGPIFHAVMLAAERRFDPSFSAHHDIVAVPADTERVAICALSGERANPWCPSRIREWVPAGADPVPCSWHHLSDAGLLTIWPPKYRAWITAQVDSAIAATVGPSGAHVAPARVAASVRSEKPLLEIANPPAGAIYSIDPTLRPEFQALPLRATTGTPTTVTWMVDGRVVGTTSSERALSWPLKVGTHHISARDAAGRVAETRVVVK
ncbi:MAG TPA: penicillin-binding protein 1C [Vicinamibacterales bacterium]|nr:penicillin-binding protein 1C [Vicinamibacterales bacterium]